MTKPSPATESVQSPVDHLGDKGLLATKIPDFATRAPQQAMGAAIAATLAKKGILIAEAGTGVGKTFAYLVPALLNRQKTIISTGTRHLQDQLFHRDLPLIQRCLGVGGETALLKGRSNYLCLHRLKLNQGTLYQTTQQQHYQIIKRWSLNTRSGDIAEISSIPENAAIWPVVTSTVDNCLGSHCPELQQCHLVKARRKAQQADIVVINHHLFFADMALKEEGFGELLPGAETLILDEAHQLPDIASHFFGQNLSQRQLEELVKSCIAAQLEEAPEQPEIRQLASELTEKIQAFRLALGSDQQRGFWQHRVTQPEIKTQFVELQTALHELRDICNSNQERGEQLQYCAERTTLLAELLNKFAACDASDAILWFETSRYGFNLHSTPAEVGSIFQEYMNHYSASWIFTSATLAVGKQFDHFVNRLGLQQAETEQFNSPFDYPQCALLYLPKGMPEPNTTEFTKRFIKLCQLVLKASQGRAFILFTSYRALAEVSAELQKTLSYPLFIQGDAPRSQLLDQFRTTANSVLLGTSSFWEGVDIKGEALSCVIIDKLPFLAPGDPVLQARLNRIRQQGGNPFTDYQLPQAIITLKQGAGRLIRDVHDRGVLVIADPRIKQKNYGKLFLESLPPMRLTTELSDVQNFYRD